MRRWFFSLFLALSALVRAGAIGVEPPFAEFRARPGAELGGTFRVFSERPLLRARVELLDWRRLPGGGLELLPPGSAPRSLAPWIRVAPRAVDVPGREARVRYRIALPPKAEGSYHVALLFRAQEEEGKGAGLRVRARVGVLVPIYVSIEGTEAPMLRLLKTERAGDRYRLYLQNQGNVYLPVRVWVDAIGPRGERLKREGLFSGDLLPGERIRVEYDRGGLPEGALLLRFVAAAKGLEPLVWEVEP